MSPPTGVGEAASHRSVRCRRIASGRTVDYLVVRGRLVAERRVDAADVVEALDEAEDFVPRIGCGPEALPVEQFALEWRENGRRLSRSLKQRVRSDLPERGGMADAASSRAPAEAPGTLATGTRLRRGGVGRKGQGWKRWPS